MRSRRLLLVTALLSAGLVPAPAPSRAQEMAIWPVEPPILGKLHKSGGQDVSRDVSGIACAEPSGFPRHCVVVDDNAQSAQLLTLENGRLRGGDPIPFFHKTCGKHELELDGEGVAFADGVFYVMGSHGAPRHPEDKKHCPVDEEIAAQRAAASQIFRVALTAGGAPSLISPPLSLTDAIASQPELQAATARPLDRNGLTIEGVAVVGDRMLTGFRGPVLPENRPDHAAILSVSLKGLQGHGTLDPRLFKLPLGAGTGIRDMSIYKGQVLLLAGPVRNDPGRYAIHLWDGKSDEVRLLVDLDKAGIGQDRKAEGLLFLDETATTMRVLLLFDNEDNGAATVLTIGKR